MDRTDQSAAPADTHEDERAAVASAAEDVSLDSSQEAGGDEQDDTLLDAIEESVSPEEDTTAEGDQEEKSGESDEEEDEPGTGKDQKGKSDAKDQQGSEDEDKDDDGEDLKPGQKIPFPRFQKVVRQKNKFREERDEYKTGHENFAAIQGFRDRNNLSDEDVVGSLQIAALINNDPAQALEKLRPIVSSLQQAVGETLPEDLQGRVDQGELMESDAKEIVRQRNENQRLRHQQQQSDQARQQEAAVGARTAMAQAAVQEQKALASQDPDFDRKVSFVKKELRLLVGERRPQTAEDARALVQEAYKNVNAELARLTRRPEVRPGPSSKGEGGPPGTGATEPESMVDAMAQAVSSND